MARLASLSVEYGHFYIGELRRLGAAERRDALHSTLERTKTWIDPIEARMRAADRTVSRVVMIDDYFARGPEEVEAAQEWVLDACNEVGLAPDWIVYESALAETAPQILEVFTREPVPGDGSRGGPAEAGWAAWLSNGEPSRPEIAANGRDEGNIISGYAAPAPMTAQRSDFKARPRTRGGSHVIHLDVELFTGEGANTIYSCPLLAAWWQLARLGVAAIPHGLPGSAEHLAGWPASPLRDGVPLAAERTLTVLDPRFMNVEHAVRTILKQVSLPEAWRNVMRTSREQPGEFAHLDRMAYLFLPEGF